MRGEHVLYRFYDSAGELLYVGITMNPVNRFREHSKTKPWWLQVARIGLEIHPDRQALLSAERRAIRTENPAYNIAHNVGRRRVAKGGGFHRSATPVLVSPDVKPQVTTQKVDMRVRTGSVGPVETATCSTCLRRPAELRGMCYPCHVPDMGPDLVARVLCALYEGRPCRRVSLADVEALRIRTLELRQDVERSVFLRDHELTDVFTKLYAGLR